MPALGAHAGVRARATRCTSSSPPSPSASSLLALMQPPPRLQASPTSPEVPVGDVPHCDRSRLLTTPSRPSCSDALRACTAAHVTDVTEACRCFGVHARCYVDAGCRELLPRVEIAYCRGMLACDWAQCAASAAETEGGLLVVVFMAVGVLVALGGR